MVNPVTTVPAALLGGYDKLTKRKVWLGYAKTGDVYAQWELANSYCCGDFEGTRDYQKSAKWFCSAAKNGYAKAQVIIGRLYENTYSLPGISVPKNDVLAYAWFELASRRINEDAIEHKKSLYNKLSEEQKTQAYEALENYKDLSCAFITPTLRGSPRAKGYFRGG